jgi:hypothetical protein
MTATSPLDAHILERVKGLSDSEKREVLDFIESLKFRADRAFLAYVNARTNAAKEAAQQGEHFTTLEEFASEYS